MRSNMEENVLAWAYLTLNFGGNLFERTNVLNSPDDVKQTIQITRKELYNRVKKLLEDDSESFLPHPC